MTTAPFVGRIIELREVTARLVNPDCRLLTVTGLGGSGKTRLAIEAAQAVAAYFPQGTVFVSLQPLTRSDLLVPTIAQALGLTLYGEGAPHNQLLDHLRGKTLLLILDNFEHLLDGATLVDSLLAHAPDLKVLATSREALSLREEWLYPLRGMATPPSVYSQSLEAYEAAQLFLYHAQRVQPQYDPAHHQQAIVRICMLTAGLPLALELAASWLRGLSTTQIAHEMQRNLDFLSTTTRNVEERHRSMRAVFDQTWRLLPENERLIFARLSVFPGSFNGDAADHVAGASIASLAALVEKSLVQMDTSGRFGIHELLRQYGSERLEASAETQATYARHSQYFAQLLQRHEAALKQPQQPAIMQLIESDFQNIRLAWDWSARHQPTQLHIMLDSLYLFGFLGRRHRETITMFQRAIEQLAADEALRGRLLARRWGHMHWWHQADYQEALTSLERALTIARVENNRFEMALCHLMLAYALICRECDAEALPHLEIGKALFAELDEPFYVSWVLNRLSYVCSNLNKPDKEAEYTQQSLALARAFHNRFVLVNGLYNLGSNYVVNGDYIKGSQYAAEALQFASEAGHPCQIAHTLSLLALHAFCRGDYSASREYAERAQTHVEDILLLIHQPYSLALLIVFACMREDYVEAMRLNELAKQPVTNAVGSLLLYWALATLSCGVGSLAEARLYIQKALQLSASSVDSVTTIWVVPSAAYTLAATAPEKAVELLGWISAYPDSIVSWACQWPLLDRLQAQLQAGLAADSYQLHWEQGAALTLKAIRSYLCQTFCALPGADAEADQQLLTSREHEILYLLGAGMTNPQIAAQLVIGAGTVKTHTLSIYRKLEVANRTQAIIRAQALGLLHA